MTRAAEERWDKMTPKARCYWLFKQIDENTRALAKLASATAYLSDQGLEPTSEAPQLYSAMWQVIAQRRNLRAAPEAELLQERIRQRGAAVPVNTR